MRHYSLPKIIVLFSAAEVQLEEVFESIFSPCFSSSEYRIKIEISLKKVKKYFFKNSNYYSSLLKVFSKQLFYVAHIKSLYI